MKTIKELEQKIREANIAYRTGESIITDEQYDTLLEELEVLNPENEILYDIGLEVIDDDRKEKIPITMASMNKAKTIEEIDKWYKSKGISQDEDVVLTPKFDGMSLCALENKEKAWTRGDGEYGQRSDVHFRHISHNQVFKFSDGYTYGEVMCPRETFLKKYSMDWSNPRNFVAGKINDKTPKPEILKDFHYVAYGLVLDLDDDIFFTKKSDQLNFLNQNQKYPVDYKIVKRSDISTEYFKNLFAEWSKVYEIDGIIIEVNDMKIREKLGRETSSKNPCYARAYKGDFEEVKKTKIKSITWRISKQGYLKPVLNVETINLDGVNVSNVTGNNAKFIKDLDLGVGSEITVKRSGMVIPKLVKVIRSTGFKMPKIDGVEIGWNENKVELVTKTVTDDQRLKQLISFFNILDVDNLGEGNLKLFFESGFDIPQKVLGMLETDMVELDRFGKRKAEIVKKSIDAKRGVTLSKLQHASGFFINLGSKKLLLLEGLDESATVEQIESIEGFSEISAKNYLKGIKLYNEWVKDFDGLLTISKTEEKQSSSNELNGMVFVFTGIRRRDLEQIIEEKGGKVSSGVSKNSTHLVMKAKGSGSAKEGKAIDLGQTILEVSELENMLGV